MGPSVGRLNIYDRRERAIVGVADAALTPVGTALRALRSRRPTPPRRILCLRLERIGDLLMILPALASLRAAAPGAAIDLAIGSWNARVGSAISCVDRLETLDARWLARNDDGDGLFRLMTRARQLKARRYDLAINFEPDIRSNLILAATGARRLAGFASGGGGPLLDVALDYDPHAHTADNAVRLVQATLGNAPAPISFVTLRIPEEAQTEAARLLQPFGRELLIGLHVNAGRAIKQWPETRFHELAVRLVAERGASLVLTGAPADRAQVETVKAALPADRVLDLSGNVDLLTLGAVLMRLGFFVTGDTGPMHLAHAVGTPVVAVFGPSDPARYAPRGPLDRVVRIDLPCAPCNRIRLPPARCVGHTPDCLAGITVARVMDAIDELLRDRGSARRRATSITGSPG